MCVYLCGCIRADRSLKCSAGVFALISYVNWLLYCLKKVSVKHQGGKEAIEEMEQGHQNGPCVSLAGVCGLKEDPHMSMNNKTDTECLCCALSHTCINANAGIFFPLCRFMNNALRMWPTWGPWRELEIGNEG